LTEESAIKKQICEALEMFASSLIFWVQESQGGWDPTRKVFRKKNSRFQKKGIADIQGILFVKSIPVYIALEVKSQKGQLTESQKIHKQELESKGGFYFVVRSPQEALKAIQSVTLRVQELVRLAK